MPRHGGDHAAMKAGGLVMAGGEARRMGGVDKPLLPLGALNCIERVIATLRRDCTRLAISANGDAARYARWNLPVLADRVAGAGPLAGVLRGLEWAHDAGLDVLVTVPGDTPFIPADLVPRLLPAPSFATSLGQRHSLVAAWPVACRDMLAAQLAAITPENRRSATRVRTLADRLDARPVAFAPLAGGVDPFFNINTPDDHQAACQHAARMDQAGPVTP
ncbi:molybdenum cofactor guanylyltransferase [Komagataeibacter saccharivorans]|uniref:molybdenum cofactor guanylyltransferase n=1 Tax=Komagataeibacter saccharivorans TaxID=265959 RepID=UPI001A9D6B40|nr:molybdenum cofactor guanylyltransferase [Komagataeibacter saccharivorans]